MFEIHELLKATQGMLISSGRKRSVRGISLDSRTIKPDEAFIAIKGNNFDGHNFINAAIKKGANCIIKEPATLRFNSAKVAIIEVGDSVRALGDIANFHRKKFEAAVIAITGSNGKTTTKEMLAWILSSRFKVLKNLGTKNNHIGLPQTLLRLKRYHDIVVVELGTNHFGEIENLAKICQPNIGIITNIGPSHLEYLHDVEGVFREKYSLIKNLKEPSIAILNADDRFLKMRLRSKVYTPFVLGFGTKGFCEFLASDIKLYSKKLEFCLNPRSRVKVKFVLKTLGLHNIYNALAAIVASRIFGIGYTDIAKRLRNFQFPDARLKLIQTRQCRFIDDTYNSNPVSLKQALVALKNFKTKGKKIFVMGDMLELGKNSEVFHYQAGREAAKVCDKFIVVGKLSKIAEEAAKRTGFDAKNVFFCDTSCQAREILFKDIGVDKDDVILVKGSRAMKMEDIFKAQ